MDKPVSSPLTRLVLFMVCLAIAGTIMAGVLNFVVDIPATEPVHPPENFDSGACAACLAACTYKIWDSGCENSCLRSCDCNPRCYYE